MSAQTPPIKRDIYRQRTCLNRRIYTCKVRNSTISFTALSDSCELLGILDAGGYITLQDPCPVQLSVHAIETDLQGDSAPAVYPEIFPCYPKRLISLKQNDQGTHYTYRLGKYCCNGSSDSINCIDFPSIFPWVKSVFSLSKVYHPSMFCVYSVSEDLFAFPLI